MHHNDLVFQGIFQYLLYKKLFVALQIYDIETFGSM